ncbi:U6 snRNA-associated Sm-like protein LSm6 [Bagarius yarrelli]|uniref:U6 snRNA-associated Sm-like protein LSm6 n=1 Tax=Bagarius yarrelli TaxID=175774 RepID=A0A556VA31_BAGYA|nr:U6 snRNA-associated Sm-like protein LSm6 [Bagarius yarrelli]
MSVRKQTPSDFLKQIIGRPVVVKLNSGVDYRGVLACLDGYMNIAVEQTEELSFLSMERFQQALRFLPAPACTRSLPLKGRQKAAKPRPLIQTSPARPERHEAMGLDGASLGDPEPRDPNLISASPAAWRKGRPRGLREVH